MSKKVNNNNQEEKSPNQNEQKNITNISHLISLEKVNFQNTNSYNPFSSQENKQNENVKMNSPKENEKDNDIYSSPLEDKQNQEIIDINTPSNGSDWGDDWNSSKERNKEKLKKGLLEKKNNNLNWSSESPNSINNKMNSDNLGNNNSNNINNNNSFEWGSPKNNNQNNNNEKKNENNNQNKDKMSDWGSNYNNNDDKGKNNCNDNTKMDIDDEIREDKGPLPEPKGTEDTFANIEKNKNTEIEATWFNRDGRNEKDEWAENNIKKIMIEHEKQMKRKEYKISELESIEFKLYYVKIYENEEPKLLNDRTRPKIKFENLNKIPEQLKENLKALQYEYLTPLQRIIMPYIQYGKDIVCVAETGSGKTLSYLFPIIGKMLIEGVPENPFIKKNEQDNLNNNNENKNNEKKNNENNNDNETNETKGYHNLYRTNVAFPLCLIIVPSRELAAQISKESKKLAMNTGIKTVSITGGDKKSIQYVELSKGCDILVCTPLRLTDFLISGKINLNLVKYLVLDEAEKLLEPDFFEQLKNIFDKLPKRKFRQNLLFSATFNEDVKGIAKYCLNNYYYFNPLLEAPKQIKHEFYHFMNGLEKIENLINYLKKDEIKDKSIIIFMNSKKDSESLKRALEEENIQTCIIHGDKSQNDRTRAIKEFSLGYKKILISTDLISRGLDFPNVYCVINYDMPLNIEDYIHRIGRTGRLGQKGLAITYIDRIDDTNKENLAQLLQKLGQEVPSWLNDIQSTKRFFNFSKEQENDWKNDNNNNKRTRNNFKNNRNINKDYNMSNKWKKKDNNDDGWGNNDNNKDDGWGKKDNKNDDRWGNKDNKNNNRWGNNDNNKDDGWGNNDNNKDNSWGNNDNKNDDGWGNNNKNNNRWGNNDNNKKNNYRKNKFQNNDNNKYDNNNNNYNKRNDNKADSWGNSNKNNDGWGNDNDNDNNNNFGKNDNNEWNNNNNNNRNKKNYSKNNDNWGNSNNNDNDGWGNDSNNNLNQNSNSNIWENTDNNQQNNTFNQNDDIEIPEDAFEELFVIGINFDANEDDLKETFSKYGEINSCKILKDKVTQKSKGLGFVKFNDKKSAVQAMNDADNLICKGRNVRVKYSNNRNAEPKGKKSFGGKKFENNNNNENTNNEWGKEENDRENNFNRTGRGDRGRGGRGRGGRGRGGRGRGRGRDFNKNDNNDNNFWNNNNNNNDSWGKNNKDDGWGNNDKKEEKNDSWGKNNNEDGWGNNDKKEEKNDSWGNDTKKDNNNNGWGNDDRDNLANNNKKENNDNAWGNDEDNWGNKNNRERSRDKDKDNTKDIDNW